MGNILVVTVLCFTAWHSDKNSIFSINNLHVMDYESVIKGYRNVSLEFTFGMNFPDADIGDVHVRPPEAITMSYAIEISGENQEDGAKLSEFIQD